MGDISIIMLNCFGGREGEGEGEGEREGEGEEEKERGSLPGGHPSQDDPPVLAWYVPAAPPAKAAAASAQAPLLPQHARTHTASSVCLLHSPANATTSNARDAS